MAVATGVVAFDAEFGDSPAVATIRVRQNDVGRPFHATCKEDGAAVDVSGATVTLCLFDRGGNEKIFATTFVNDGVDGKVKATLNGGTFTAKGGQRILMRLVESGLDIRSGPITVDVQAAS